MRRYTLALLLLLVLEAAPVQATGFGLFRRPSEVRYSSYYVSPVIYYVPVMPAPVIYPTAPLTVLPPVPLATPFPAPFAAPLAAPPSTTAEPPAAPVRPMTGGSTSLRVGEAYFEILPGPMRMDGDSPSGHCSVAFWNLTGGTLSLRIDGRDMTLPPGRSTKLDLPLTFAWQVVGREAASTTIPPGRATAEVLIRR